MPTHEIDFKDQILKIAEQTGAQLSETETALLDEFLITDTHTTPAQLSASCREKGFDIDELAAEDMLRKLCRFGAAHRREFNINGKIRTVYEHQHLMEHHDHLTCVKCGKILDFFEPALEDAQKALCRSRGFSPLWHQMNIYGICEACRGKRAPTLPLTFAARGEAVQVRDIRGGDGLRRRLADMGIIKDVQVEVLNSDGPMLLAVRDARVALGMGMASKIMVTPISRAEIS